MMLSHIQLRRSPKSARLALRCFSSIANDAVDDWTDDCDVRVRQCAFW